MQIGGQHHDRDRFMHCDTLRQGAMAFDPVSMLSKGLACAATAKEPTVHCI